MKVIPKPTKNTILLMLGLSYTVLAGYFFFSFALPNKQYETERVSKTVLATETIASSHSLKPVISNQWYSSLFFNFPSQPLFALPIAYQFSPNGISFSYPELNKTRNTIFAPFSEDFTIGDQSNFLKPKIQQIGDWHITGILTDAGNKTLSFTIGHGLPYAILHTTAQNVLLTSPNDIAVGDLQNVTKNTSSLTTDAITVTSGLHTYILVFPSKIHVSIAKKQITFSQPHRIFVGLLDKKEHSSLFKQISDIEISDTQAVSSITSSTIDTTYQVTTNSIVPLLALYPYQFDYLNAKQSTLGTYHSLRGDLQLFKTSSFTIKIPLVIPKTSFDKLPDVNASEAGFIKTDITSFLTTPPPASQDYYLGTWFGKGTNLLLLADTYGMDREKQQLLQFMEPLFLKSLDYFTYVKNKTSVMAKSPEFGNDKLNDHHFHYGYFIRTAAVLASLDSEFLPKIQTKTQPLVQDIATIDRSSDTYPFLRTFDLYESHSWADGYGNSVDSVNQESSSEAINAWYALFLWSKVTNNSNLTNYALFLYNSEIIGAKYYWFDDKNMYSNPYVHAIASIVWGGKIDFSTFFSPSTNLIYGIQLIPFTPASMYLGTLSDFTKYENDYSSHGGNIQNNWGDTFLMWKSFYKPQEALNEKNQVSQLEPDNPKSLFLYFLQLNSQTKSTP